MDGNTTYQCEDGTTSLHWNRNNFPNPSHKNYLSMYRHPCTCWQMTQALRWPLNLHPSTLCIGAPCCSFTLWRRAWINLFSELTTEFLITHFLLVHGVFFHLKCEWTNLNWEALHSAVSNLGRRWWFEEESVNFKLTKRIWIAVVRIGMFEDALASW